MAKFGIALGSGPRGLGFESRHSDQKEKGCYGSPFLFGLVGIRKTDPNKVRVRISPADCFLGRGRIHCSIDAPLAGVDREQFRSILALYIYLAINMI